VRLGAKRIQGSYRVSYIGTSALQRCGANIKSLSVDLKPISNATVTTKLPIIITIDTTGPLFVAIVTPEILVEGLTNGETLSYAAFDLTAAYPLVDNAELGAEAIRYEMHGSDVSELQGHLAPFNH
jgi:hypothetical protein